MRTENEIATEAANKILSSRVQSAEAYWRYYMTAEENRLWPNVGRFVADVNQMVKFFVG